MAQSPINYLIDVQDPFESAIKGYQLGSSIRQNEQEYAQKQQEYAQKQQEMDRTREMYAEMADLARDPSNITSENIFQLQIKYPQLGDHFTKSFGQLSEAQKRASIKNMTPVFAALQNGNPDLAIATLEEQKKALINSGMEDRVGAIDAKIAEIKSSPDIARFSTGMGLANLVGADDFKNITDSLNKPSGKIGTYKFDPKLGIFNTETGEVSLSIKDLGVPTIDPEKKFDQEEKLRKDFNNITKDFREVRDSFSRVQASGESPSAAGDLALIFNYMKILDPGSTVREGEFATAQNSAGVPEIIRSQFNRILRGERLTDSQRSDFLNRANILFKRRQDQYKKTSNEYRNLAKRYDLSQENIVLDLDILEGQQKKYSDVQTFNSVEEAESKNLPAGTEIIINGRRAIVE